MDIDARRFISLKEWLEESLGKESESCLAVFETLMENVNYHLSEATKTFNK